MPVATSSAALSRDAPQLAQNRAAIGHPMPQAGQVGATGVPQHSQARASAPSALEHCAQTGPVGMSVRGVTRYSSRHYGVWNSAGSGRILPSEITVCYVAGTVPLLVNLKHRARGSSEVGTPDQVGIISSGGTSCSARRGSTEANEPLAHAILLARCTQSSTVFPEWLAQLGTGHSG